jgi:hypothetical protein
LNGSLLTLSILQIFQQLWQRQQLPILVWVSAVLSLFFCLISWYDAVNVIKSSKDRIPPRIDSYLFISRIPVQHFRIIVIYILLFVPLALTSKNVLTQPPWGSCTILAKTVLLPVAVTFTNRADNWLHS